MDEKKHEILEQRMCRELDLLEKKYETSAGEMSLDDLKKLDLLYHTLKSKAGYEAMTAAKTYGIDFDQASQMNQMNQMSGRHGYSGRMSGHYPEPEYMAGRMSGHYPEPEYMSGSYPEREHMSGWYPAAPYPPRRW